MSLRYDRTEVDMEDQMAARQISFTETVLGSAIKDEMRLVQCVLGPLEA